MGAPGMPAYATPPEQIQEVFNESINFFYVNIFLAQVGGRGHVCALGGVSKGGGS